MFVLRLAAAGDTLRSRGRARLGGGEVGIGYVEIKTILESLGRWLPTDLRWLRLMTLNHGDAEDGVSHPSGHVQGGSESGDRTCDLRNLQQFTRLPLASCVNVCDSAFGRFTAAAKRFRDRLVFASLRVEGPEDGRR